MNYSTQSKRLSKVCTSCAQVNTCARPKKLATKCYQTWYNKTQRNKAAEKLRQAFFRATKFEDSMCSRIKSSANSSGHKFNLDVAWFKRELKRGTCEVTGLPFVLPSYTPNGQGNRGPWAPSVDRIDNTKGYTKANCRMVVWIFNLAKSNYKDQDFARLSMAFTAKNISKIHKGKQGNIVEFANGMHAAAVTGRPV